MEGLNTWNIDILWPPAWIQDFISRNFPDNPDMIKRADVWKAYQAETAGKLNALGRTALFYAMHRDGWTDHRTSATTFFKRPPADPAAPYKDRIAELEAENARLMKRIKELEEAQNWPRNI